MKPESVIMIVSAIVAFIGGILLASIYTQQPSLQGTVVIQTTAPVLNRIGGCESSGDRNLPPTQINPRTGQVRTHANSNGTTDIGAYQINIEVWGKKASNLGYDLSTFEGNKAMAEWIYANKGTGDWSASKPCWK